MYLFQWLITWAYLCNSKLKTLETYLALEWYHWTGWSYLPLAQLPDQGQIPFLPEHLQIELYPIQNFKNRVIVNKAVCFWKKIMLVPFFNERQVCCYLKDIKLHCIFEENKFAVTLPVM